MTQDLEHTKLRLERFKTIFIGTSAVASALALATTAYLGFENLKQQALLTFQTKVADIVDHSTTTQEAIARLRFLAATTRNSLPLQLAEQLDRPGVRFDTREETRRLAFFDAISRTGISPADTVNVYRLLFPGARWERDKLLDALAPHR